MIIKGRQRGAGKNLALHILNRETNERVKVLEVKNTIASTVMEALLEIEDIAAGTRTEKFLYHAQINVNTYQNEALTDEQWIYAADRLGQKLGFSPKAPRIVVLHEKKGRQHAHVVWSRLDPFTLKSVKLSNNYLKHEEVARELERRFGHGRVQGAHAEREGVPRPARTPSNKEMQQQDRTDVRITNVQDDVLAAWAESSNGREFQAAILKRGYVLARGDRRTYVLVDRTGNVHSLRRRLKGVTAAQVSAKLEDIALESLPSVADVRATMFRVKHSGETSGDATGSGQPAISAPAAGVRTRKLRLLGLSAPRTGRIKGHSRGSRVGVGLSARPQVPDIATASVQPSKTLAGQRNALRKQAVAAAKDKAGNHDRPRVSGQANSSRAELYRFHKANGTLSEYFRLFGIEPD